MTKPNYRGIALLMMVNVMLILLMAFMVNAGCITAAKTMYRDATATPVPTPTPTPVPTPKPTPVPTTPVSIPTFQARYVDPYLHGERWEGQWFKWLRQDVQGINGEGTKDLNVGIITYRHAFLDKITWYNNAMGNYYEEKPGDGNRYFVVWVHEEMIGENSTYDPSMWIFDQDAFRLQVKDTIYAVDPGINPVNPIKELENSHDYYDTTISAPFGYLRRYTGFNPETGGWVAERLGWLRLGKSNAVDGYMIFQIPKGSMPKDIALIGSFSRFGSAYWKFV